MRALCPAVMTVALLVGSAIGVAAQSEVSTEPASFTDVTGTVLSDTSPQEDWQEVWIDGAVVHVLGWRVERVIDWSDPRLPPTMMSRGNVDTYLAEDGLVQVFAETYRLDGPAGAWIGTGRAFGLEHGQEPEWLMLLTGVGAYEGLSAMLVRETVRTDPESMDSIVMKGTIFEADLPPMPNPVEPPVK